MKFGVGQSLKRLEDDKFLTGNGTYNDDINFQDQVYMHIVRSPFSFAKIIKIDSRKAQEYQGVITILNHDTIKSMNINPMYPGFTLKNKDGTSMTETYRNILADDTVRYVGEPVLAVIGTIFGGVVYKSFEVSANWKYLSLILLTKYDPTLKPVADPW